MHSRSILSALLLFLLPTLSFAADPVAQPAEQPLEQPAADVDAVASPQPAATEEAVGLLGGRLDALEEQYAETKQDVFSLKRLRLSGYVQARLSAAENSVDGVVNGAPGVKDGFSVRRGRLKATYEGSWSKYVLQIDATPKGVVLKDAEAWLIEPWTGHKLALIAGQTKWPFGYEGPQSSSQRELPERSRVVRAFLPGERDRGAKISGKINWLNFSAGVFNGNGTENKASVDGKLVDLGAVDNDREKDFVGRVGFDFKWITGGVSGWYGKTFDPDPAVRVFVPRNRVGADLQVYLDLLPFGATAIKGEFIRGRTYSKDGIEQLGVPAAGWYALVVQNLGLKNAVAIRYDYFDPALGTKDKVDSKDPLKPASTNPVGTLGAGLIHYWDDSLKLSAFYEIPMTKTACCATDPKDNVFTLQMQASF